ncbi:hypothetical protein BB559_001766 [Furculomyces boomerangus]|uniref:Mitochondrial import receptor subunit TOM70 n=2 Tax=Harpellales TaxID=61421 RepID=A0A2T9Z0Q7_9FUNG|nr:hypothetical protein BB559_001766 [Furculomyces boomerangus]PVZ99286.1 hypothetical protein BB558_004708 [Smittium angustum]
MSDNIVQTVISKPQSHARDWKTFVSILVPSVAIAGLAIYYYSRSISDQQPPSPKRNRRKNKKKNHTTTQQPPKTTETSQEPSETLPADKNDVVDPQLTASQDLDSDLANMPEDQILLLSQAEKKKISQQLKSRGNKFFQAKRYEKAINLYTSALKFDKDPVFYSNRAACYAALQEYEKVVTDCNSALKIEPLYIKALMRRAQSYESINNLRDSLYDYTTICIIQDFKNNLASAGAERVLKNIAEAEAKQTIATREPRLPSKSFISGYFNSFISNGKVAEPTEDSELTEAEKEYNLSLDLASKKKYAESIQHIENAIKLGIDQSKGIGADAYSLKGTYNFLKGSLDQSELDFNKALELDPSHVRTMYRKANMYTEKKEIEKVDKLIASALSINPKDPEGFFQSGQVWFLKQDFDKAAKDYQQAINLDQDYVYPYIQLGVAQFKMGQVENAMQTFNLAMARFPNRSDLFNYYGEVLAEQGGPVDAAKAFEKSIGIDRSNPLPYVNKAISTFQTTGNFELALSLIKEAMTVDPECELAVAALSQIYLQLGMFEDSLAMLRRAVELAKSEEEMISTITFRETTAAQYRFIKEHPEMLQKLSGL